MVCERQQAQVGLDAALRVQQERVAAVARLHLLHFVAGDVVQQAHSVAAADRLSGRARKDPATRRRRGVRRTFAHAFSLLCRSLLG